MGAVGQLTKRGIRRVLRIFDIDVHRYSASTAPERLRMIDQLRTTIVLDVGANTGQYAEELRASGYRGRILSFEPLPDAFVGLNRKAAADPHWSVLEMALGDADGTAKIHMSANSVSSSILDPLPQLVAVPPHARDVGVREVALRRLDSLDVIGRGERGYLKIDVQGYELASPEEWNGR